MSRLALITTSRRLGCIEFSAAGEEDGMARLYYVTDIYDGLSRFSRAERASRKASDRRYVCAYAAMSTTP